MAPFLALAGVLVCQSLVGSKIDSRLVLDFGFPSQKINLAERVANKKVILVGLPGAFTPT
jgi:peroxiredoxin